VIPIGPPEQQVLHTYVDGDVVETVLCRFVPLVFAQTPQG
jgi:hypothetical protein